MAGEGERAQGPLPRGRRGQPPGGGFRPGSLWGRGCRLLVPLGACGPLSEPPYLVTQVALLGLQFLGKVTDFVVSSHTEIA